VKGPPQVLEPGVIVNATIPNGGRGMVTVVVVSGTVTVVVVPPGIVVVGGRVTMMVLVVVVVPGGDGHADGGGAPLALNVPGLSDVTAPSAKAAQ